MQEQLEDLVRQFDEVRRRGRALGALPTSDWERRAPDGGWSPAECVQHLNLTAHAFLPRMRAAIDHARRDGRYGAGPFSRGLVGAALAWWLEPPYRARTRTAAAFAPLAAPPQEATLAAFDEAHAALAACVRDSDGLDLGRVRVASPFAERLRYNLYAAFCVTAAHARRHLWQAGQAQARDGSGRAMTGVATRSDRR
jgi:hypothetical protein